MNTMELSGYLKQLFLNKLNLNFDIKVFKAALEHLSPLELSDLEVYVDRLAEFSAGDTVVRRVLEAVCGQSGCTMKIEELVKGWNAAPSAALRMPVTTAAGTSTKVGLDVSAIANVKPDVLAEAPTDALTEISSAVASNARGVDPEVAYAALGIGIIAFVVGAAHVAYTVKNRTANVTGGFQEKSGPSFTDKLKGLYGSLCDKLSLLREGVRFGMHRVFGSRNTEEKKALLDNTQGTNAGEADHKVDDAQGTNAGETNHEVDGNPLPPESVKTDKSVQYGEQSEVENKVPSPSLNSTEAERGVSNQQEQNLINL